MNAIYDVNYFIKKFEAIPESEIGTMQITGCAYGQCRVPGEYQGGSQTPEGKALTKVFSALHGRITATTDSYYPAEMSTPARVNNGETNEYQQPTPKQRILAALYDIKAMQEPKVESLKERIVYVTVDQPVRELQKEESIFSN